MADSDSGSMVCAEIINLETDQHIKCMFNPQEYGVSKSNRWKEQQLSKEAVPLSEYQGSLAGTFSLNLLFDTYEAYPGFAHTARSDVRRYTNPLWGCMQGKDGAKPPQCQFVWGRLKSFVGVITTMTQTFVMFLPDGTPVRAKASLTVQQIIDENAKPKQNPTSGGHANERLYVVKEGDTLVGIAYAEYRDTAAWRHIAEINGIDDPLSIQPGQRLLINPRSRSL